MNVICPTCTATIAQKYTNRSKGLTFCKNCDDYYLLDKHLKRNVHLIKRKDRFIKTRKPKKTNITIQESEDKFLVTIPRRRLPILYRIIAFLFLMVIGFGIYQNLIKLQNNNLSSYDGLIVLAIFALPLIAMILLKGSETELSLDQDFVVFKRRGFFSTKVNKKKTRNLDYTNVYVESDHEGGSSSGIEIVFRNKTDFRFGEWLSTSEQEWLCGQLILRRRALQLDPKVNVAIQPKLEQAEKNPLVINRIKPDGSKIDTPNIEQASPILYIPQDQNIVSAMTIFMIYLIGMTIFGTVALGFWGYLPVYFEPHSIFKYVFSIFALMVMLALFYYIYTFIYRAEHRVVVDAESITIEFQPFGYYLEHSRPTKALTEITRSREWHCVLLKFDGYKDLRVGFSLTDEDIAYVIGRIKKMVEEADVTNK